MSEKSPHQFQEMSNEELIDFALKADQSENEEFNRKLALQEHFERIKDDAKTVIAPPGDVDLLRQKITEVKQKNH